MSTGSDAAKHTPADLESQRIADGACVIYHPDETDAWLWSDLVIESSEVC